MKLEKEREAKESRANRNGSDKKISQMCILEPLLENRSLERSFQVSQFKKWWYIPLLLLPLFWSSDFTDIPVMLLSILSMIIIIIINSRKTLSIANQIASLRLVFFQIEPFTNLKKTEFALSITSYSNGT
jgi:hypothetical protein